MRVQKQTQTQKAPSPVRRGRVRPNSNPNDPLAANRFMAGGALSFLEPSPYSRQRGCVVEPFTDNVLVTPNNLLYADKNYFLKDISSFQVVKLSCRKSAVHKKFLNLLGTLIITIGLILYFSSNQPILHLVSGFLIAAMVTYLSFFYWQLLHQKVGEYGLLIHMQPGHRRVITSHSLRAIQNLFQSLLQCLERPEETDNFVSVNMYTGDIYSQ